MLNESRDHVIKYIITGGLINSSFGSSRKPLKKLDLGNYENDFS